jgi:glutathione S-transferase
MTSRLDAADDPGDGELWQLQEYMGDRMSYLYTAAATLLTLVMHQGVTMMVGKARARYGVKAPAIIGNEHFERAYRVQMNTIEQMVFFLPAMWLCAVLLSDIAAAVGGVIWVIGRVIYAVSYVNDPATRGRGMMICVLAQYALWLGAAVGLVRAALG